MTKENRIAATAEWLSEVNNKDLVELFNSYCEAVGYDDDRIQYNESDFFETYFHGRMMELVQNLSQNDSYNYRDDYVRFDGNGWLESKPLNRVDDWIDCDEMARYVIDEDDDLGDSDLRDFLDELEPEDEDEN